MGHVRVATKRSREVVSDLAVFLALPRSLLPMRCHSTPPQSLFWSEAALHALILSDMLCSPVREYVHADDGLGDRVGRAGGI